MEKIKNLPQHIAVIPDGNRRWAKKQGFNSWLGHRQGVESLEKVLKAAFDLGIPYFSFWGSSLDNITKRSRPEVKFLLNLFAKKFTELAKAKDIHQNKVQINVFGRWQELFPKRVSGAIEKAIEAMRAVAGAQLKTEDLVLEFFIDAEIPLKATDWELEKNITKLAPFGEGNREPIFASRGLQLVSYETMGLEGKHLKLTVRDLSDGTIKKMVAFGWGEIAKDLQIGGMLDVAYTLSAREWNGNRELQLKVEDLVLKNPMI